MTIIEFPPIEQADESGLLAIGGDLEVESLLLAYQSGIFPWPHSADTLLWFAPPQRAVLFSDGIHLSKSLSRAIRKTPFTFCFDRNFRAVMEGCASTENRRRGSGTWIYPHLIDAYCQLHKRGYAHSIECYDGESLVGGLYGVSIARLFCAESMFYRAPDASKMCLVKLVDHLRAQGIQWIDLQVINPFTEKFGAEEIPRRQYMKLLRQALRSEEPLQF